MLQAGVRYLRDHQDGVGISAVSTQYAKQLMLNDPLFDGLTILGHPNPVGEASIAPIPGGAVGLALHKRRCKEETQRALGLTVDADALLIGFVGRWTHEKGIDLVM